MLYYFTYVEGSASLFSMYSLAIIIPSVVGAACFPYVFKLTKNKGWSASVFAFGTGVTMIALYFFSPVATPVGFYVFSALSQFFSRDLTQLSMPLSQIVWSTVNGKPGSETMDFSMPSFRWAIK